MKITLIFLFTFAAQCFLLAQTYTSFRTGNAASVTTQPLGGVCLMGGAGEQDEAMK